MEVDFSGCQLSNPGNLEWLLSIIKYRADMSAAATTLIVILTYT